MSSLSFAALWAVLFLSHIVSACMPNGLTNSVTQGTDTYVCIVLSPLTWGYNTTTKAGGKYLRIPSKLAVDNLARINVPNSWTSADYSADAATKALGVATSTRASTGVGISVSSMGVTSYQKAYRINDLSAASDAQRTFPMLFALIAVDKGKVISVTWDDTCKWCLKSHGCAFNTYDFDGSLKSNVGGKACYLADSECAKTAAGPATTELCALHVYVSWTGVDSQGRYLSSAASRLSRLLDTQVTNYTSTLQATILPIT